MPGTELLAALLGSVALLLWGVRMVRTGLTRAFGAALRRAILAHTRTRSFLTGQILAADGGKSPADPRHPPIA